jgi:hypothetical protein
MSDLCEKCGGSTHWYLGSQLPSHLHFCYCIPKAKHDGKLNKSEDGEYDSEVWIDGCYIKIENLNHMVVLDAKEALSLLAWLKQEESTLEELAKEQDNG